ncbi:4Fe-4S binding protein [Tepidibacter aestuarii]|uniref:4Fe-4S binding protein n=1 Tax=Tepidibacter aestuarii TaxID=2925782 RepID=UPI0020C03AD3|nr:4Fe-4S binding protein [Tepidibacter aestuarii]CAH2212087.1 4Fe-4S binding protein [Tepidibacter aestuarii]
MNNLLRVWKKYGYILLLIFIVAGLFDKRIALAAVICMVGPLVFAFFNKGRFWCGNICPRGSFFDNIISKFSNNKPVPKLLKSNIFRVLVIIFLFYMFGSGIYKNWGNTAGIGMVFYRIIVVTTLVGICLSFFYNYRSWCNFCPMGSMTAFISYLKKDKEVLNVSSSCVSCRLCEKKCPMGIVPYNYKENKLDHPDCIQCGKCMTCCPKNAINYKL